MVRWASRTFFDDLLEAGVKIYHFEAGLLHTKSVLIDNKLALVGTVNMDLRSFLLNFEITVAVEDRNFANEVATLHENYLGELLPHSICKNGSIVLSIIESSSGYFSCLVHYSNFHSKYKRAYHTVRPFFFLLMINVFHDKH
ncbi:MAG: phospholipase D-like domain-containing protein [Haemophilus parainfluenzae]